MFHYRRVINKTHTLNSKRNYSIARVAVSNPMARRILWPAAPVAGIGYYLFSTDKYDFDSSETANQYPIMVASWKAYLMKMLPLRAMSRLWGSINRDYELPVWMRYPVYMAWTKMFGCNLAEMKADSLQSFRNLDEFFTRELKAHVRPVDEKSLLVSPADGTVLHLGPVESRYIEQVKDLTYSLDSFLGLGQHALEEDDANKTLPQFPERKNRLYHCVIYLAPGDYHRFHSPSDWIVEKIKHFTGQLLSVSPSMAHVINDLFVVNERIVMNGRWQHGFFSMTAVGATNVGSIQLAFDSFFQTNHHLEDASGSYTEKCLRTSVIRTNKLQGADQHNGSHLIDLEVMPDGNGHPGYVATKGSQLGRFHLGSTVVLIFEAPEGFEFTVKPGRKLKYGEPIGRL